MRLHLSVGVGHSVGHVHLIARVHEAVIEAHCPVGSLLLRVQVIYLLLVRAHLVGDVIAATLDPATFAFLEVAVHFGGPN